MLMPTGEQGVQDGWRHPRRTPSLSEVFGSIATRPHGSLWRKLIAFLGPGYLIAVGYMGEQVIQFGGLLAHEMREHLALLVPGQIGARRRRGQIELRGIAGVLGHGCLERRRIADADRIARAAAPVKSLSRDARSLSARALSTRPLRAAAVRAALAPARDC